MELNLDGHTALVSGSYRGTGAIIAQRLAQEGARVLVHGLAPGQAEAAVAELGCGVPVTGDITGDAGAEAVARACAEEAVDVLVNNFGTTVPGTWTSSDSDAWIDAYHKNVLSAQRLIRHFLPAMVSRGWGRIINLGTIGSTRPAERMPHYYAAKGALATATMSLARETAGTGVRVNLVSPGLIHTPEVEAAYRGRGWGETWAEIEPRLAADIPIRRIVRREEVADLIAFLASPRADALHGQNVRVDGGALDGAP
ncbi:MAG: SDR family NAD(P)-dependent oxidoreductase [Pseudomonadota bacterium]